MFLHLPLTQSKLEFMAVIHYSCVFVFGGLSPNDSVLTLQDPQVWESAKKDFADKPIIAPDLFRALSK